MKPILDSADVVVIGAGIAGITTAYELRKRGYEVVVVEQRFPAYGASGRSTGSIWLQTCQAGIELDLAKAGRDKYNAYIEELGNTFDFHVNGGMFFFETEDQGAVLEDYIKDRSRAGLNVSLLSAKEARQSFKLVPETALGAVFCEDDAQVDTSRFVQAVSGAAAREGVRIYENTAVLSTIRQNGRVIGVRTVRGDIMCPSTVWATGAWALNLTADGVELPIETARQGQILTQQIQPFKGPILRGPRGAMWASALTSLPGYSEEIFSATNPTSQPHADDDVLRYDDTISQNGEGGLLIGSSVDAPGALNPHIGIAATEAMLTNSLSRYPDLSSLGIVGVWAGVTSWTNDHLPIIDKYDGIYLNVAHSRGVATGPIGGQIMAGVLAGDVQPFAEDLTLSRFAS